MRHASLALACGAVLLAATAWAQADRMRAIDPLGGGWQAVRIGPTPVPPGAEAWVRFSGSAEYYTQAGCIGARGRYRIDGRFLRTRELEAAVAAKCRDAGSARREVALGRVMARAATYALASDGSLRIVAQDGTAATFRRPPPTVPALEGRWIIETIGRDAISADKRAQMEFRPGWLTAVAGCNRLSGSYKAAGSGFVMGDGMATEMGCGPVREAFDRRLFAAVGTARRFVPLAAGRVRLEGAGESLSLRRPAPVSTRLPGTYSACRSNPGGVMYDGTPTLSVTASAISDSAGCVGTYRTNGAELAIVRDASPACAAPPLSPDNYVEVEIGTRGSILALLRPDGYAFDDEGVLRLRTLRGLLDMCRQGAPRPFGS